MSSEARDPKTRLLAVQWMASTGRGCKLAAAHFKAPLSTVKGWRAWGIRQGLLEPNPPPRRAESPIVHLAPPAPAQPAAPLMAADYTRMSRAQMLEHLLHEAAVAMALAKDREQAKSMADVAKHIVDLHADLEVARAAEGADGAGLSDEEYEAELELAGLQMADRHIEVLMRVYAERHRGAVHLVTDTHASELRADGWAVVSQAPVH